MFRLVLSFLLIGSSTAFAGEKVLLSCTTIGDALSSVDLVQNSKGVQSVRITELDLTSKKYRTSTLFNSKSSLSQTLVGYRNAEDVYGGEMRNAILLQVNAKGRSALMAHRGSVFYLNCQ